MSGRFLNADDLVRPPGIRKSEWMFVPVYFFLTAISVRVKIVLTPSWWLTGDLASNHARMVAWDYINNEQSRILQFLIPEFFHRAFSISIENAYVLQRFLFFFLSLVLFHFYLRKWFAEAESMLGVTFLVAVIPLSYFNHLQESAALLMLTFLWGLWAVRENRIGHLLASTSIGAMNNMTILMIPFAYFCFNIRKSDWFAVSFKSFLVALPSVLLIAYIRFVINRDIPHATEWFQLPMNLDGMRKSFAHLFVQPLEFWRAVYLNIFIIYGVLWIYAFLNFKTKPLFLRRAAWIIPPFILGYFITGIIYEVRQMIPLAFIIIPLSMFTLFRRSPEKIAKTPKQETPLENLPDRQSRDWDFDL